MNVYDYAHQLARAMKDSNEYQEYKRLDEKVKTNSHCQSMRDDFTKRQIEIKSLQMMGEEVDEKKLQELQELYKVLMQNPLMTEFMHAEFKLSQMMEDIYKILGEALNIHKE